MIAMRLKTSSLRFLSLTMLGSLAWPFVMSAQQPVQQPAQQPAQAKPKEASAIPKPRELAVPVTGLAKESVAAVRADLLALTMQYHACAPCGEERAMAGTCSKCKGDLKPASRALFTSVTPTETLVTLTADPRAVVKLSEVESVLKARSVAIDDDHFTLSGRARLLVASPPTDAATVEKALKEAKLFGEVKVEPDPTTNQLFVTVQADANPPTRAKVTAALEGAKARLVDILWVPFPLKS
jgi:hypothetical protein